MTVFIDPGRSTGVAIFDGPSPIVAKLEDASAAEAHALLTWAKARGHTRIVVEDQHVVQRRSMTGRMVINWPALQVLILSAHRWVVIGEMLDFSIASPKAQEWQGPMHRTTPTHDAGGKKLRTKERSKIVVARTYSELRRFKRGQDPEEATPVPAAKLPHDICDAICMGRWWQLYRAN